LLGIEQEGKVKIKKSLLKYAILPTFIIYSSVWAYVVLLRYYSFNANVFDLGLASGSLYSVFHGGLIATAADPKPFPFSKMMILVLAPFYYFFPNPAWLPVFQSIWIGVGIFPLYYIAKAAIRDEKYAAIVAMTYLLYYPLSGANWFDFHFMAMFPTFFLTGFALRLSGKNKSSIFAMTFAAISDYLVPVILVFYAIYIILDPKSSSSRKERFPYILGILAISMFVFLAPIFYLGRLVPLDYTGLSGASYSTVYTSTYLLKAEYVGQMQLPVLFASFISPESLIMAIPYFTLAFVNNYQPYLSTMYFQYPTLTAPITFIAFALGIARIKQIFTRKYKRRSAQGTWKVLVVIALFFNLALFSLYTPVGELYTSSYSNQRMAFLLTGNDFSYNAPSSIQIQPYDSDLMKAVHMVPLGSSVLIQNNMPELVSGYNWTLPDFYVNGTFPYYILVDPYSYYYDHFSVAYHTTDYTMKSLSAKLLASGKYSILYSEQNITLYML
jgi:uncharacterized membrane protein